MSKRGAEKRAAGQGDDVVIGTAGKVPRRRFHSAAIVADIQVDGHRLHAGRDPGRVACLAEGYVEGGDCAALELQMADNATRDGIDQADDRRRFVDALKGIAEAAHRQTGARTHDCGGIRLSGADFQLLGTESLPDPGRERYGESRWAGRYAAMARQMPAPAK